MLQRFPDAHVLRCPFVRAVSEGRLNEAAAMAAAEPEPAEPAVIVWLLGEAARHLDHDAEACVEPGCGERAVVTAYCPEHWF